MDTASVVLCMPPLKDKSNRTRLGLLIPLGLSYIGAMLLNEGISVKVVDPVIRLLDIDKTRDEILKYNPKIVGLFSFTSTILDVYNLAKSIKHVRSDIKIILGGPHASAAPQQTLEECTYIDAVVIGEGEVVFKNLVKILINKKDCKSLLDKNGLMMRINGKIVGNTAPAFVDNLDDVPFPARELFDIQLYKEESVKYADAKNPPVVSILTSRGCPGRCIYCCKASSGGTNLRVRSPANVIDELKILKKMGFKEVFIQDDLFTADRLRVIEICRLIKENNLEMNFALPNGIRVDQVDYDLLKEMKSAGFYSIHFGIESGDQNVLNIIRKGTTIEKIKNAVKIAHSLNFFIGGYFIVGLPGSSTGSEKKSENLIKELKLDFIGVGFCTPYPGTEMGDIAKKQGVSLNWSELSHISNKPPYIPENMSSDDLINCHKKLIKAAYYNPLFWTEQLLRHGTYAVRRMIILFRIARLRYKFI